MNTTITTQAVSKALSTDWSKSKSGGNAARSGRWTTAGFTTDSAYNKNEVVVTYEFDNSETYNEKVANTMLNAYAQTLIEKGYTVTFEKYSVPFIIVTK